ncbi:MAG TPA: hypothetical protein VF334_22845, partial [Polyangia bacterium]
MSNQIGIHSVGVYLPDSIRRNDYWPRELVEKWRAKAAHRLQRTDEAFGGATSEGTRMVMEELRKLGDDPFQGLVERRTMPEGMTAADMETAAARDAIARAGISPKEIGVVLSYTMCPDFINVPTACVVHSNLGLSERCLTMAVDAVCNSFMMQLTFAQGLIAAGRARYALLTQSSAITRMPMSGEHYDTWFGDAGTAVVVGPVADSKGILSVSHHTDGSLHKALVLGVPGKRWFDDGKTTLYCPNREHTRSMLLDLADHARDAIRDALAKAGI